MTQSTFEVNTNIIKSALNQAGSDSKNTETRIVSCASTETETTGTTPEKPTYLSLIFENFPKELTDLPQWLVWKAEYDPEKKKWKKRPYSPVTGYGKWKDHANWGTFEDAKRAYQQGDYDGVSFVLCSENQIAGIDLDSILTPEKDFSDPDARNIFETLASYTDISPSGNGIRTFCFADIPKNHRKRGRNKNTFELYTDAKVLTMTGHILNGNQTVENRQSELEKVYDMYFKIDTPKPPAYVSEPADLSDISDSDLLEKMFSSKNGDKIRVLYDGNSGDDHSYADASLCSHLAFWTGKDAQRMDALFRQSGLYREKWDEKNHFPGGRTYGQGTIDNAIAKCAEVYTPQKKKAGDTTTRSKSKADPEIQVFNLTDFGNAERLIHRHGDNIRFSFEAGKWLVWNGKFWEFDNKGEIQQLTKETVRSIVDVDEFRVIEKEYKVLKAQKKNKTEFKKLSESDQNEITKKINELEPAVKDMEGLFKHAKNSENNARVKAMIELGKTEPGVTVDLDDFDSDQWVFNCQNGTLNLRTGELKPHNRLDLNTKISPVQYDPSAECPLWEKFLDDVFQGDTELIRFMQRSVGYALTGDTSAEVFWVLYGKGSNGKGTFIRTVMSILSDYGKSASFPLLCNSTEQKNDNALNQLALLKGARFVSASEGEENAVLNESNIKNAVASDSGEIIGRFKYCDQFSYTPEFKIFLATNYKPIIKGTDDGIWRRVMLIPFEKTFKGEDRDDDLKMKLQAELPGILNWMIQGCLDYQTQGLNPPAAVINATQEYRNEMDVLSDFLDECCKVNPDEKISVAELYKIYKEYCIESGTKPFGKQKFNKKLEEKGFVKKEGHANKMFWQGLSIVNSESEPEPEPPNTNPEPEAESSYKTKIPEKCISCNNRNGERCRGWGNVICEDAFTVGCKGKLFKGNLN